MKALCFLSIFALPALGFAQDLASIGLPPTMPAMPATASPSPTPSTSSTSSGPSVSVQFTSAGLSSLQWNGVELLGSGAPSLSYVGLIQPDGTWTAGDTNPTTTADVANRVLTQKYAWGTVTYTYTTTQTQLFADVTIQNTSATPMGMFIMQLAEIQFPSTPSEYDGSTPMVGWNMGNPTVIPTTFGANKLVLTNEDVANPLMVGWPWALDSGKTLFPVQVLTGQDSMYSTSYPVINRQVPAGGSLEFKLGFRFGAATTSTYSLASDLYQRFATTYPNTLKWTDHRPVAQLFLTNPDSASATNPRCWFNDPTIDVTTPAGVAAFQQRVLAFAQSSVAIAKAENAQAVITWDIEGQQFPQPTTFIGDPRLIDTLAPEMSGVVDAYFKTFTDAGLRVGMTIRPQQLVLTNSNQTASQQEVADPGQLMLAKMTYAYNRWGATVFYVDSNGAPDNPIDPKFFQEVTTALPNVLIIPEHANLGYYAITAPYGQLNMGCTGTPATVVQTYPNAFSVFTISDADVTDNMAALVSAVARGDALFFRGWFAATENAQVEEIYATVHSTNTTSP